MAIHDGVRPLISKDLIEKCFSFAQELGNAVPAIQPNESIRYGTDSDNQKANRDLLWLIQTPQVFNLNDIKEYYRAEWQPHFTDDASVAEYCGMKINIIEGERENIKITTPWDLKIAECIIGGK